MQQQKSDSQRLLDIERSVRRQEVAQLIQTTIVVVGFLGILSLSDLVSKIKK